MPDLSKDPIQNAINDGIKRGIRVTLENRCFGPAIIFIYSGIDTMAYLDMPESQEEVQQKDFVRWIDRCIRFPCTEKISGVEFYGARCAMLHQYGVVSRLSRQGRCRKIGYMDVSVPEVRYNPEIAPDTVLVSVAALADAFFEGVDRFLIDLFAGPSAALAEQRIHTLVQSLPARGPFP